MKHQNAAVQNILNAFKEEEPLIIFDIFEPDDPINGTIHINYGIGELEDVLQYRATMGYGVFSSDNDWQTRPDEIYKDAKTAVKRALQLLKRKDKMMHLKDFRDILDVTQIEMAQRLNINQAAISKFENRSDVKLSTFKDYVEALGGRVQVSVVFPDFEANVNL